MTILVDTSDREFTTEWWTWLVITGVLMACTWGSKVNGILTVFTIGAAVLIDLWDILDYKKEGHTMVSPNTSMVPSTPNNLYRNTS